MTFTIEFCDIEVERYLQIQFTNFKNVRKACWES